MLLLSEVKTNLEELNQILTKIDEKLKSDNEWIKAKTTEVNSGYDKTFPYNELKNSRWDEVESIIIWIVFIIFFLMVVYIVWFSKKNASLKFLT